MLTTLEEFVLGIMLMIIGIFLLVAVISIWYRLIDWIDNKD